MGSNANDAGNILVETDHKVWSEVSTCVITTLSGRTMSRVGSTDTHYRTELALRGRRLEVVELGVEGSLALDIGSY